MSLSFTMLLCMCLHRTQAPVQIFLEFFIGEFTEIINVPVFVQVEQ